MTAGRNTDESESGIMVYPRLPVPEPRRGEPRQPRPRKKRIGGRMMAAIAVSAVAGGAGAWFAAPVIAPDPRIGAAIVRASAAEQAAAAQKQRADALEQSLDTTAKARRDADARLAVAQTAEAALAGKVADETARKAAAQAALGKLKAALDRSAGTVALDGDDIHVQIADRVLWKPSDDALTDRGKAVLGKLAAALKDLPDRQVWVQGHTDDQPPQPASVAKPVAVAVPKKGAKPAVVAPPVAPVVRFATNWELSAARALAVVHYLQDIAKLEPTRLTALAFGQYAPVSSKDKAANRRLEIVVVPRRAPAK